MLNGILWILRTGAPWRDLPERLGPWQTVYHYFNEWRRQDLYDRILEAKPKSLALTKPHVNWNRHDRRANSMQFAVSAEI